MANQTASLGNWVNNSNFATQNDSNGAIQPLMFYDSNNNLVIGPVTNTGAINNWPMYKGPGDYQWRKNDFKSYKLTAISDIAAHGLTFTSGGGALSVVDLDDRRSLQISTGATLGGQGTLEMKGMRMSFSAFQQMWLTFDIPTGLHFELDFGLWDGSRGSNAIYAERYEGNSTNPYYTYACAGGTRNGGVNTTKGGDTDRWTFMLANTTYENGGINQVSLFCSDPNNFGIVGLLGTMTADIPVGVQMWPFIQFTNTNIAANRVIRLDQLSVIAAL